MSCIYTSAALNAKLPGMWGCFAPVMLQEKEGNLGYLILLLLQKTEEETMKAANPFPTSIEEKRIPRAEACYNASDFT
eukprot:scaffold250594_cov15-Tisochrysis_lutea.AAC.1